MARIVINEKDLTTATKAPDTTDIVFVPGLMGYTLNNNGEKVKLQGKKYTPTLCQTVTAFENYFGKEPYQFQNAETYNGIEVEEGDFDPGYIYAKELLAAGLQVVYEALDESISQEEYSLVKSQPSDFTENYTSYYTKGKFSLITNWKYSDIFTYIINNDNSTFSCVLTTKIKDSANLTENKYYKFIQSNDNYINIPNINVDSDISVSWNDDTFIKLNVSGAIYLKTNATVESGSVYYVGITNAVPNIDAKKTGSGAVNNGLVISKDGTIEFFEDNTAVGKGIVQDKDGNYYFINSSLKAIKNTWYAFDADKSNGLLPAGRYFATESGILLIPDNIIGCQKTIADKSITLGNCAYAISTPENSDARASTYSYIDSLNGVYQKNNLKQQSVLSKIYSQLATVYHTEVMADSDIPSLSEKGEYSIKYITSGGYPNYGANIGIYSQMMTLAADRGDAVALVDAVSEKSRTLNPGNEQSLYYELQTKGISNGSFGTMMFPWINVNLLNTYDKNQIEPKTDALMPASFAYLKCLATSLKQGNPNWLSIAGVTRGLVSNLVSDNPIQTDKPVTNAIADYYQGTQPNGDAVKETEFKYAINAITNIKPYGYCIWGNRTLAINVEGQKATNYLNIRNLVSDIKKICYTSARRLMFEQNDDILWTKFLSYVTPTLDKMNSGSGVSGYKVIKLATDEHAKLAAKIIIFPVYAVENFEITVELKDEEITVEE